MTDWAAIAALAPVGTVLTGYLQYKAAKNSKAAQTVHPSAFVPQPVKPSPTLLYTVQTGSGSYQFPKNWQVDVVDERWVDQTTIKHDLQEFHFAVVKLINPNDFAILNIDVDIGVYRGWSVTVERTTSLAKRAITIEIQSGVIGVSILDFPAKEEIVLAIACGGGVRNHLESKNSAITLKRSEAKYA